MLQVEIKSSIFPINRFMYQLRFLKFELGNIYN